jgi:hypothetical protein
MSIDIRRDIDPLIRIAAQPIHLSQQVGRVYLDIEADGIGQPIENIGR